VNRVRFVDPARLEVLAEVDFIIELTQSLGPSFFKSTGRLSSAT